MINIFRNERIISELSYNEINNTAVQIMEKLDIHVKLSRGTTTDFETYIRTTVNVPFYDYLISELQNRFFKHQYQCPALQTLILTFCRTSEYSVLHKAAEFYKTLIEDELNLKTEFQRWQEKWWAVQVE